MLKQTGDVSRNSEGLSQQKQKSLKKQQYTDDSSAHTREMKRAKLNMVIPVGDSLSGSACWTLLRLTVRSNVKPKCGNNSSEGSHVFL